MQGEEQRMGQGYEELWKGGNLDFARWGGIGREMSLELKFGINAGKDSPPGKSGKMDERVSEMRAREVES